LLLQHLALQPLPLPLRIIAILDPQFLQPRSFHSSAFHHRSVQPPQFLHHYSQRPTVTHDVVHGHQQHMLLVSHPEQLHPQQRPRRQIKSLFRFLARDPQRFVLTFLFSPTPQVQLLHPHPALLTRCTGLPCSAGNTVRSTSCRLTISSTLLRSAPLSNTPFSLTPNGMLYAPLPGSICSINHNRCCAYDGTTSRSPPASSPSTLLRFSSKPATAFPHLALSRTRSANSATVGDSNNTCTPSSTPNTFRTRDITCVANSECPPSSKKLSSSPTPSRFNTSSYTPTRISSSAPIPSPALLLPLFPHSPSPAPTTRPCFLPSLSTFFRSTFPFSVSGSSSTSTYSLGTIYPGTFFLSSLLTCST